MVNRYLHSIPVLFKVNLRIIYCEYIKHFIDIQGFLEKILNILISIISILNVSQVD